MSAMLDEQLAVGNLQLTTFYVADMLLGLPIECVQEINHNLAITAIPNAPQHVRGVINLRGEVTTVIDLRRILRLPPAEVGASGRNLIVRAADESVGLLVDQISDIISVDRKLIAPPPANLAGTEGRFFTGVCRTDPELVAILNLEQVLAHES